MARRKRRKGKVRVVPVIAPQRPPLADRLAAIWAKGGDLPPALVIVALALAAYWTALGGGYIWDDREYLTANPLLFDLDGLRRIWFTAQTPQYYPIVFSTFWIEKKIWGADPFGYHLINVFFHAANAVLVWRLLRYLRVPGAWLAGAIFAVHPVHVESVAWITERKNVLSGLFYLLALRQYLVFESGPEKEFWKNPYRYAGVLALFACALLSKSVTASLPAVILIALWLQGRRLNFRMIVRLIPFFVIGAASGLFTAWLEVHKVGASGEAWDLNVLERFLLAGQVVWFYLWKIIWPANLTFSYPRWGVEAGEPLQYLGLIGAGIASFALWWWRKPWGRGPAAAALFFLITLGPVLGFLNVYPMLFSWVADHFQYLASIGPIALAVGAATWVWREKGRRAKWGFPAAAAVLAVLGVLTWGQGRIYESAEVLWRDTIRKNPKSWMAHNNLGNHLAWSGRHREALSHYRESLKYRPTREIALNNIGNSLLRLGKASEAIEEYRRAIALKSKYAKPRAGLGRALVEIGKVEEGIEELNEALRIRPGFPTAHNNLGLALTRKGKLKEAAAQFLKALEGDPAHAQARFNFALTLFQARRYGRAIKVLREGVRLTPEDMRTGTLLAWLLATAPRPEWRDGRRALALARKNLAAGSSDPLTLNSLAAAYAELGQFPSAVNIARQALRKAESAEMREEAAQIREYLRHYEGRRPYRSP